MTDYSDKWYLYMLLRTVVAGFFVYVGYMTKNIFLNCKNKIWPVAFGSYLVLAWFFPEKWTFDLHYAVLPDEFFYYLLGFLGILSVAGISQIASQCSFLRWAGKNSVCIMITHLPIVQFIRTIMTEFVTNTLVSQILVALITLALEILIVWLVNHKLKFLFRFPKKEEII